MGRKKLNKTRVVEGKSDPQRKREYYAECRKSLLKLGMDKMDADLAIAEYLSQLPEFEDIEILYEKGSTLLINNKPTNYKKKFINYEAVINVIKGTKGNYVQPVEEFKCPYDERYCRGFRGQIGKGKKPLDKDTIDEIRNLYRSGMSIRIVADRLGLGTGTVGKYVKGIKRSGDTKDDDV